MATVVSIMDRPSFRANTDVIVVADPPGARLLWVPRDLWSPGLGNRVNRAYAVGGHGRLAAALAEHGIAVDHGLCLGRAAIERATADVAIRMPVERSMSFWYPLAPARPIEEGRKRVTFAAPVERLAGERLHQWVGARYAVEPGDEGDLHRIRRQQQLVAVMLGAGFDFQRFLAPGLPRELTSGAALDELAQVRADWRFETFGPTRGARIDGKAVLVKEED